MSKKNYYNKTNKRIKTSQKKLSMHKYKSIKNDPKTKV